MPVPPVLPILVISVAAGLAVMRPGAPASEGASTAAVAVPESMGAAAQADALRLQGQYARASSVLGEYLGWTAGSARERGSATASPAGWQLSLHSGVAPGVGSAAVWRARPASSVTLALAAGSSAAAAGVAAGSVEAGGLPGVAVLRRGRVHAEGGRTAAAMAAYDSAAHLLPWLQDWTAVFAASAAASAGDVAAVQARRAPLDSDLAEWAWRTEVRALRQAGNRGAALAAAEGAARTLESPARRAAAWTLTGQWRLERGDGHGARLALLQAVSTAEQSAAALEAAGMLMQLPDASATDRLVAGRTFLKHGQLQRGTTVLTAFLDSGAGSPAVRHEVMYDIGMAAFRGGDYQRAERRMLEVADVAHGDLAAEALFIAGRARFRTGRAGDAMSILRRAVANWPATPGAGKAAFLVADLMHDDDDVAAATSFYRAATLAEPGSTDAAAAWMRLGGMAYADRRFDDALREFMAFRAAHNSGRTRQQAAFWAGMAAQRADQPELALLYLTDARDYDPFSYYGGLAAEQLGEDEWRLDHSPPDDARHQALAAGALLRVDALRAAGFGEAAAFEMERVRRHFMQVDGALYAVAEILNERGSIATGVSIAREIHRHEGAWNPRLLRIVYPFPFRDIILAEARSRDVDPFLAAALIRQESLFNPGARSPVGATGLMQVMPATARGIARQLSVPRFSNDMLVRPELNVAFGTRYLADQLRTYGERIDLVLAAYNAGPGRVSRWRALPEFDDRLLFAERIPFDETRDYVRIVQNNRRLYAALYAVPAETRVSE